jgi:hypothetical protein
MADFMADPELSAHCEVGDPLRRSQAENVVQILRCWQVQGRGKVYNAFDNANFAFPPIFTTGGQNQPGAAHHVAFSIEFLTPPSTHTQIVTYYHGWLYYVYYLPMMSCLRPSVPQAAGLELAVRAWWRGAKSGCGRKEVRGA